MGPLGPIHVISEEFSLVTVQMRLKFAPTTGICEDSVNITTECINSERVAELLLSNNYIFHLLRTLRIVLFWSLIPSEVVTVQVNCLWNTVEPLLWY